jgi:hypothetical protein
MAASTCRNACALLSRSHLRTVPGALGRPSDGQAMKFPANMYEGGYLGPPNPAKAPELRLQAERVGPDSLPPNRMHLPLPRQTPAASAPGPLRRVPPDLHGTADGAGATLLGRPRPAAPVATPTTFWSVRNLAIFARAERAKPRSRGSGSSGAKMQFSRAKKLRKLADGARLLLSTHGGLPLDWIAGRLTASADDIRPAISEHRHSA